MELINKRRFVLMIWVFLVSLCGSSLASSSNSRRHLVPMTLITGAASTGAVCLDGSPPAYNLHKGSGSGAKNWLLDFEGGGWCNDVSTCRERANSYRGSTKHMTKSKVFSGILADDPSLNPEHLRPVFLRRSSALSLSSIATDDVLRIVSSDLDLLLSLSLFLAELSDSLRLSSSSLIRLSLLNSHPSHRRFSSSVFSSHPPLLLPRSLRIPRSQPPPPLDPLLQRYGPQNRSRWTASSPPPPPSTRRWKSSPTPSTRSAVTQTRKRPPFGGGGGESFDSVVSLLAPFAFVLLLFRILRAFLLL
ncbi:hypothetical protein QJS10_CPB18g01574 [Acorus calamus]|uniref:Pectin acetylesterase n=1 Tax=Acorus calamus TaxID=4465 RepID=A0AAV9CPA6_ACOCL|nr:hypothetical protein QJS10_CPB18g01574 [Acorus calamus]